MTSQLPAEHAGNTVDEIQPEDKNDPITDVEHLESQKQIDSAYDTKYASRSV
jgi:hypothetical protein